MAEIQLKPCPFCGGKAVFKIQKMGSADDLLFADIAVGCSKCKLRLPVRYSLVVKANENGEISIRNEQQKAADAWNRRASDG